MAFLKSFSNRYSQLTGRSLRAPRRRHKDQGYVRPSYTYCPNCSYRIRVAASQGHQDGHEEDNQPRVNQGTLPEGFPAEVLLSNSPAAQILLTENNRVQYANKAAIHLLGSTKNHDTSEAEGNVLKTPGKIAAVKVAKRAIKSRHGRVHRPDNTSEYTAYNLEGLALKELPIGLEKKTRNWINLEQIIESIKLDLQKESERIMQDLDDQSGYRGKDDDFYRQYYAGEDEPDNIAEYYARIAEREARQEERENTSRGKLKTIAERKPEGGDQSLNISGQEVENSRIKIREGNEADTVHIGLKLSRATAGLTTGELGSPSHQLGVSVMDAFGSNTLIAKQSIPVLIYRNKKPPISAKLWVSVVLPGGGGGVSITKPYTSLSILPGDINFAEYENNSYQNSKAHKASKPAGATTTGTARVLERVTRLKDMILDEMDYFFICVTPDGEICVTNKATTELLGVGRDTFSGEGTDWVKRLDIFREDFSERLPVEEWALNTLIQDGKPTTQTIGLYTQPPGPRRLTLQLRGKPLWKDDSRSEMLGALAVVVDQTEYTAREQLAIKKYEVRNAFLKRLEWKIKTPIAGSVGLLNLLYQTAGLSSEQKKFVENLYRTMNTLMLGINDLSGYSQIEQDRLCVEKTLFSVGALIRDLQKLCNFSFIKENIEFEVITEGLLTSNNNHNPRVGSMSEHFDIEEMSVDQGIETTKTAQYDIKVSRPQRDTDEASRDRAVNNKNTDIVMIGDEGKLRGILICMLSNAFKFTHQGKVTFTVQREGGIEKGIQKVKFEIKDTGVGFSKETQKQFLLSLDEVMRNDVNAATPGAAGISFAIAKSHADLLGAQMGCISEPDRGSTFYLIVPLEVAPDHATAPLLENREHSLSRDLGLVLRLDELRQSTSEPSESTDNLGTEEDLEMRSQSIEDKSILIVEDNWTNQIVMEKRLSMLGLKTKIAVTGEDALTLLKKETFVPDIILMDLHLPMMDGFETSQRIRQDPELAQYKNVPIIAVTASESKGDRQRASEVGMDDFMLKPLHQEYLKVILRMALRKGYERIAADKAVEKRWSFRGPVGEGNAQSEERIIVNDGTTRTARSIKSVASSGQIAAASARSARTTQLMKPPTRGVPEVTLTSATPVESDKE